MTTARKETQAKERAVGPMAEFGMVSSRRGHWGRGIWEERRGNSCGQDVIYETKFKKRKGH